MSFANLVLLNKLQKLDGALIVTGERGNTGDTGETGGKGKGDRETVYQVVKPMHQLKTNVGNGYALSSSVLLFLAVCNSIS